MQRILTLVSVILFGCALTLSAQTAANEQNKEKNNYGQQRSSEVNKGQQGEKMREQNREKMR